MAPLARQHSPNEAETEAHLVFPVLEQVLGWTDWLPQQNLSATGRLDVPDALLFADAATLERAGGEPPWQRFQHGLCLWSPSAGIARSTGLSMDVQAPGEATSRSDADPALPPPCR